MFQYTGEYFKTKDAYGSNFYTFTPAPLCKGVSLDADSELLALLTMAHKLLGVLESIAAYLPDADSIKKPKRALPATQGFRIQDSGFRILLAYASNNLLTSIKRALISRESQ